MPKGYQAVQAGHAVAQFIIEHPDSEWKNNFLIYLNVADLQELENWLDKLKASNEKFSCFIEPDLNDEMTAVAVKNEGKIFRSLKLL